MNGKNHPSGLILIELVVSLVLIGIIGVFTGLFIYTGVNGYLNARDATEGALRAQVALDRIRWELRDIDSIASVDQTGPDYSIIYTSDLAAFSGSNRTLEYHSGDNEKFLTLKVDTGPENKLLTGISSFSLAMGTADLDGISGPKGEVSGITVTFTLKNIGQVFTTDIYPRNMVEEP